MSFSMSNARLTNPAKPPLMVVHGDAGTGKTTLAAQMPSPFFISLDDGLSQAEHLRNVANFPPEMFTNGYRSVLDALKAFAEAPGAYKTLVIDNLSVLEKMIWAQVAAENGKDSIEKIPYGKGYNLAIDKWQEVMRYLLWIRDSLGVMVVLIAHTRPTKQSPPDMPDSYTVWEIQLDSRALDVIKPLADAILFARIPIITEKKDDGFGNAKVRVAAVEERRLYCQPGPGYTAKSRYPIPQWIRLAWSDLSKHLTGVPSTETPATA